MFRKLVGDRSFYKRVLALMIPIMIQNGITNFVNMLDNVMVGKVGTLAMTGVAVANQLIFVFNLLIFGAVSGAGIFTAQFFGKKDYEGVKSTFRFKLLFCSAITIVVMAVFYFKGGTLINLYLGGEGSAADIAETFKFSKNYLLIMLIGLLPYTLAQCFGSTLREIGQPVIPMTAGIIAVFINLVLNYALIFGHFGAPKLGVIGAAIATVISRFAELGFLAVYAIVKRAALPFIIGAFKGVYVPFGLIKNIAQKGFPLMLNEALWAGGIALVNQSYSLRGLEVVAANNISQTFFNVFAVAFMSVGVAIGIMLGHELGDGQTDNAMSTATKSIAFSVFVSIVVGLVYIVCADFIPLIYNTTDTVREMATRLMQITALVFPLDAFAHASYFTLRSGGKVIITLIFDSFFVWLVSVPMAFVLVHFTTLPFLTIFAICQFLNFIKCILGYIFVRKGDWIKNIVAG